MRFLSTFSGLAVVPALALVASTASAQDTRYLSWSGKPETPAAQTPYRGQAQGAVAAQPVRNPNVRYPSMAAMARPSRYSPSVASGALTPADAWFQPGQPYAAQPAPAQPQPQYQPPSAWRPDPSLPPPAYATPQAHPTLPTPAYAARPAQNTRQPAFRPAPQQTAPQQPTYEQAPPRQAAPADGAPVAPDPVQTSAQTAGPPAAWTQPGYAPQVYPAQPQTYVGSAHMQASASPVVQGPGWASPQPAMTGAVVADPMAPRRDAPIFSIQAARNPQAPTPPTQAEAQAQAQAQSGQIQGQPQSQAVASVAGPAREGPRYYSVHRQAGHEPDPTQIPESVYAVIPEGAFLDAARTDLADPPAAPVATRTINGRIQQVNRGDDGSLP